MHGINAHCLLLGANVPSREEELPSVGMDCPREDAEANAAEKAPDSSGQPFTASTGCITICPAAATGAAAFVANACVNTFLLLVCVSSPIAGISATRILTISGPFALKVPMSLWMTKCAVSPSVGTSSST
jgi:hypothetical protein